MMLSACTSQTTGSMIDYRAINCAGWVDPPKLPKNTDVEVMRRLLPVYQKLQECSDYRRTHLFSDLTEIEK